MFHKDVPLEFIQRVFKTMNENPQHTFQVLTKRSDILLKYHKVLNWTHNIWMGVSVEDERVKHRIDDLRQNKCKNQISFSGTIDRTFTKNELKEN